MRIISIIVLCLFYFYYVKEPFAKLESALYNVPERKNAFILPNSVAKTIDTTTSKRNLMLPRIKSIYSFAKGVAAIKNLDSLILSKETPQHLLPSLYHRLFHQIKPLSQTTHYPLSFTPPLLLPNSTTPYGICNPTIIPTKKGYLCIVRLVSYGYKNPCGKKIYFLDPTVPRYVNENAVLLLNKKFQIQTISILDSSLAKTNAPVSPKGLYDVRIIPKKDTKTLHILGCSHEYHQKGLAQMIYGTIACQCEKYTLTSYLPLIGPDANRHEKNWMTFWHNQSLYALYLYDPFSILRIHTKTGNCSFVFEKTYPYNFSRFSGSAPPIPFNGGMLFIIHEKVFLKRHGWFYSHRFVWARRDGYIQKVSYPFVFQKPGVEFCCGLCKTKNMLIISYGIDDSSAYIATLPQNIVRSMLYTQTN